MLDKLFGGVTGGITGAITGTIDGFAKGVGYVPPDYQCNGYKEHRNSYESNRSHHTGAHHYNGNTRKMSNGGHHEDAYNGGHGKKNHEVKPAHGDGRAEVVKTPEYRVSNTW